MYRYIKILVFFLLVSTNLFAQDPQFSQFYANPLYLGPSFAGTTDGSRVVTSFRDQWPKIPRAFITYSFSYDQYFRRFRSGTGILFVRDQAGTGRLSTTSLGWQYSYNLIIHRQWRVRPGLHFLYTQRTCDYTRNTFVDQISIHGVNSATTEYFPYKKVGYLDCSSSVAVLRENQWYGFSVDHLLQPNQSFMESSGRVPMKLSLFGSYKIVLHGKIGRYDEESLAIACLYRMQKKFKQFDIAAYWLRSPFILGASYRGLPVPKNKELNYRNMDAFIFMVGIKTVELSVFYTYDFTISRLLSSTSGSHEVSIIYLFNQEPPLKLKKKRSIVSCPKFQII